MANKDVTLVGNGFAHLRYLLLKRGASSKYIRIICGNNWSYVVYEPERGSLVTSRKKVVFNTDDFLKYAGSDIEIRGFPLNACTLEEAETEIVIKLPCLYVFCASDRLTDISLYQVVDLTHYRNGTFVALDYYGDRKEFKADRSKDGSVVALGCYGNKREFKLDENGEGYHINEDGSVEVCKIYLDKYQKLDTEAVYSDLFKIIRSRTNMNAWLDTKFQELDLEKFYKTAKLRTDMEVWVNDKPVTGVSVNSNITLITDNSSDNRVSFEELRLLLKIFSSKKLIYEDEEITTKPVMRGSHYVFDTQKYFARIKIGTNYIKSYTLYEVVAVTDDSIFVKSDVALREVSHRGTAFYDETDGEITLFGSLSEINKKIAQIISSFQ